MSLGPARADELLQRLAAPAPSPTSSRRRRFDPLERLREEDPARYEAWLVAEAIRRLDAVEVVEPEEADRRARRKVAQWRLR